MQWAVDIVLVSESWFKSHHSDEAVGIDGYQLYRRDRKKRKGGGVAIYIRDTVTSEKFEPAQIICHDGLEIMWIKTCIKSADRFVCCVYHPPKPPYDRAVLFAYITAVFDNIQSNFYCATVCIAGDFNQLSDTDLCTLGLFSIVQQSTHRGHYLDRVYTSNPIVTHI